ncbi:MAG: universal stress protein [Rubricella sp.]
MFSTIMVPVDLAHADRLGHAIDVAAEIARQADGEICFVGVTSNLPGKLAHTPAEFADRLGRFGAEEASKRGVRARSHAVTSHDPRIDVDQHLLKAIDETGADLVVMATHAPNIADRIWPSHGGDVAARSPVSVLLVREPR